MPAEDVDREIRPEGQGKPGRPGDVPDPVRRRYLTEGERVVSFFADASSLAPSFRDHGDRLTAGRSDPHALRDMARIAVHRGWSRVEVRGSEAFRRSAWLALSREGLEVEGYRPSDRERQQLERARRQIDRTEAERPDGTHGSRRSVIAERRLEVIEALVQSRVRDEGRRNLILDRVRDRLTDWVDRGRDRDASVPDRAAAGRRERARGR